MPPPVSRRDWTPCSYSYPVGVRIFPRILPEAAGGDGALTYTLGEGNEVLPPGMVYVETRHRALAGTPQVEGDYELTYRAVDADDNLDPSDSAVLKVVISVGPAIPVSALLAAVNVGETEGVLVTGPPPKANAGPSVEPEGNRALVSGGAIFVDVAADAELARLLLSVDMQSYYEIDLAGAMAPYRFVGHVMPGIEEYSPLCLSVMGVAADGTVGEPECHPLVVVPEIGTGDLEIAVSWDTDADLDLHVVDANGARDLLGSRHGGQRRRARPGVGHRLLPRRGPHRARRVDRRNAAAGDLRGTRELLVRLW